MRPELRHIEHIERYLEGQLSPAERRAFEQRLASDAHFRAEVHLQRDLVHQLNESAFLADIAAEHAAYVAQQAEPAAHTGRQRWWWGALALLIGLGGGGLWWLIQQPPALQPVAAVPVDDTALPSATPTVAAQAPERWMPAAQVPFLMERLSAQYPKSITLSSIKGRLSIPANALVDAQGNPVRGQYELAYRALEHPADYSAAGLPLLYEGETAYGIQSAALLEVRAYQNGAPLYLAEGKTLALDLELPDREADLTLYHLNSERQWQAEEQPVTFPEKGAYTEKFDSKAYQEALEEYKKAVEQRQQRITRTGSQLNVGTTPLLPKGVEELPEIKKPERRRYFVRHYDNPHLVEGLQLASFGVYNCGSAYQVKNQVAIAARYTDQQRQVIEQGRVLSVVDLDYNAAYSFAPAEFLCNSTANNIFLLWTEDGELYSFVKRAEVELKTGTYSFKMDRLSERIQGLDDLREYLDFVREKVGATPQK